MTTRAGSTRAGRGRTAGQPAARKQSGAGTTADVAERPRAGTRSLDMTGELTIYTAAEWRNTVVGLFDGGIEDIEVSLSGVAELDTAGLQLLLLAKREAAQLGRRLKFLEPSQAVTEVLTIAHLTPQLDTAPIAAEEARA